MPARAIDESTTPSSKEIPTSQGFNASEPEHIIIENQLELRKGYSDPTSSKQLKKAALADFDAKEGRIRKFLDGGE